MRATSHVQFERPRLERRPGNHPNPAAGRGHTRRWTLPADASFAGSSGGSGKPTTRANCGAGRPALKLNITFLVPIASPPLADPGTGDGGKVQSRTPPRLALPALAGGVTAPAAHHELVRRSPDPATDGLTDSFAICAATWAASPAASTRGIASKSLPALS
jgi:hypothetical protein